MVGKQRKVEWVGGQQPCFGKKFSGEKENVRLCCRDTTASSFVANVGAKSSHIFMQLV
jgi:hypothetical protein